MEIVEYRDLEIKDQLLPLMHQALWWPCDHRELDEIIEIDERLNNPVGFCGVKDDRLAGFVGVLDIPIRSLTSIQKVGSIWTVATNPSFARQGVFKALMNRAHGYFQKQDYPFSFLFTGRTLIAYKMYKKLGYKEVKWLNQIPSAYKLCKGKGFDKKEDGKSLDWDRIYELYKKSVTSKTGFVIRQDNFKEVFKARKRIDEDKSIQVDNGYALLSESDGVVRIREIIAEDESSYDDMLSMIEQRAKKAVIDVMVVDKKLEKIYKSREFFIQPDNYGVLLVKKLSDVTLQEAYGDNFHIRNLDTF